MTLNHLLLSMLLGSINYIYNSCLSNLCLKTSDTRDSTISPSNLLQVCAILTIRKYFPVTYLDLHRGRWSPWLCFLYTVKAERRLFLFLQQPCEYLLPGTQTFFSLRLKGFSFLTLSYRLSFPDLWSFFLLSSRPYRLASVCWKCKNVALQILQNVFIKLFAFFCNISHSCLPFDPV